MKVVFPRFTFCMGCTNNILHVPFHWQRRFTSSSKMSLGDRLWKTQNLMFFLQFQFWNHRFAIAKHQISSWSHGPATRNSCASTSGLFKSTTNSAFQVPELRITKKKRGTRKGAVSAGYLVFPIVIHPRWISSINRSAWCSWLVSYNDPCIWAIEKGDEVETSTKKTVV